MQENGATIVEYPDCPGCHTQVGPGEDIRQAAQEALEGWLEAHLVLGRVPPLPPAAPGRSPAGRRRMMVPVAAPLALRVQLRAARHRAGLTQAALARKVGVRQQQIAALESPDANITLGTLLRVAEALGQDVAVAFTPKLRAQGHPRNSTGVRASGRPWSG
jgi:DNA-binding XRE family transcriptional regulator/predicted RNase H-like HicB family nuclease